MKVTSLGGCFGYCIGLIICLYFLIWFLVAIVGLLTGHLYLMAARGEPAQTIHGVWARVVSGIILAVFAALAGIVWKHNRTIRAAKSDNNKDNGDA